MNPSPNAWDPIFQAKNRQFPAHISLLQDTLTTLLGPHSVAFSQIKCIPRSLLAGSTLKQEIRGLRQALYHVAYWHVRL